MGAYSGKKGKGGIGWETKSRVTTRCGRGGVGAALPRDPAAAEVDLVVRGHLEALGGELVNLPIDSLRWHRAGHGWGIPFCFGVRLTTMSCSLGRSAFAVLSAQRYRRNKYQWVSQSVSQKK